MELFTEILNATHSILGATHRARHGLGLCGHNELFWKTQRLYHRSTSRNRDVYDVLLYAPLKCQGLSVQAKQLVHFFEQNGLSFRIAHHTASNFFPELQMYQVSEADPGFPRQVLFMEYFSRRFRPKCPTFLYVNVDQLSDYDIGVARKSRSHLLVPLASQVEKVRSLFPQNPVTFLEWPAPFEATCSRRETPQLTVLYLGNDLNEQSRKHPFEVIEAVRRNQNPNLGFILKFRSPISNSLKENLKALPSVLGVIDSPVTESAMKKLYEQCDVVLLPNESEGLGLGILEARACGAVPIVLDGEPMNTILSTENAFFIACQDVGAKGITRRYQTTADQILSSFGKLNRAAVNQKASSRVGTSKGLFLTRTLFSTGGPSTP